VPHSKEKRHLADPKQSQHIKVTREEVKR